MDTGTHIKTVLEHMRAVRDRNWSEAIRLSNPRMAFLIEEDRLFDNAAANNYDVLAEGPVLVSRLPRR